MEYIVIKTFTDDRKIADKIIKELLKDKLIASAQLEEVDSSYFWKNEIINSKEFKLEFRSKKSLFKEIESVIKSIHNYEVPEISMFEIKNANEGFFEWIEENIKKV